MLNLTATQDIELVLLLSAAETGLQGSSSATAHCGHFIGPRHRGDNAKG